MILIGKYVVYREHTMGILYPDNWLDIHCAHVTKGATFQVHPEPTIVNVSELRLATEKDFDDYRISFVESWICSK